MDRVFTYYRVIGKDVVDVGYLSLDFGLHCGVEVIRAEVA